MKPGEQRKFQAKLIFLTLLVLVPAVFLSLYFKIYFLAAISLWVVISLIAAFLDVPSMVRAGKLNYQSAFLLSEKEKDGQIVVHGGTLFDYYFSLEKKDSPKEQKIFILSEYLSGLLQLAEIHKNEPDVQVKGTTYILNERTAKKIGFEVQKTDVIQKILLVLNYPNLLVTRSVANKKLSLPGLTNIRTYTSNIRSLRENREKIGMIRDRLLQGLPADQRKKLTNK